MSAAFGEFHQRPGRVLPAMIIAGLLVVTAVVLVWSTVQHLTSGTWPGFVQLGLARLSQTPWASVTGWVLGIAALILGLILLTLALAPGHFTTVRLAAAGSPHVRATVAFLASGGLARLAACYASEIDGVEDARATLAGRRLRVRVRTTLKNSATLRTSLRESLTTRLGAAGVDPMPTIVIKTSHREIRV
jgi:Family of unknown function (DUF6286)